MAQEEKPVDVTATQPATAGLRAVPMMDEGRFAPGAMVAHRYRVVSLLGRGGMGEVYRANDLMVGETVALKFLPEGLAEDESLVSRFRNEVRVARMVTHPNVCRVHDLAEADGRLFLSMEFIDGEDLASLLRRIGRLPEDKALEIARKLCAGLQAAHDKGVIHRDLKPANIMIDGRGEVVITDFGLAGVASSIRDVSSGTPAYMAPEQREGKAVTERSDIYSLGLVLYEVFTGKKRDAAPKTADTLNPEIARVLDACCDADSAKRPASAAAVGRALPGGDPLAAALAAGRTPTPEMVAAAGEKTGLSVRWALLLAVIPVVAALAGAWSRDRMLPVQPLSPEELRIEARELVRRMGGEIANEEQGVLYEAESDVRGQRSMEKLWMPHRFWYRTSRYPLGSYRVASTPAMGPENPPLDKAGMTLVVMDMRGKLIRYEAVRGAREATRGGAVDWDELVKRTGVDAPRLQRVRESQESPSWDYRDAAGLGYRIDGVSERGAVGRFRVRREGESDAPGSPWPWRIETIFSVVALLFAVRNYRLGRADLQGTLRLTLFVAATTSISLLLRGVDVTHWTSSVTPVDGMGVAVLIGLMFGSAYFAMEPFVRRRWPVVMVTWTRLLRGDWKNPTVGRDVLIGMSADGLVRLVISGLLLVYGPWDVTQLTGFQNTAHFLANLLDAVGRAPTRAVFVIFLLYLARVAFRKDWLAGIAVSLLMSGMVAAQIKLFFPAAIAAYLLIGVVRVGMAMRFGFLAVTAAEFFVMSSEMARTLDGRSWFGVYSYVAVAVIVVVALAAFRIATAGQRIFEDEAA